MSKKNRIILLVGLIVLLGVAIYLVQTVNPSEKDLPAKVDFEAETVASDGQLAFRFIPQSEESATYTASYTLSEDGVVIDEAQDEKMAAKSRQAPIVITTQRDRDLTYSLDMQIKDSFDRVVHEDSVVVNKDQEETMATNTESMLENYMRENATSIVEEEAVLGGTWQFVKMETVDADNLIINATFEDGHIQARYEIDFSIEDDEVSIEEKELLEEEQIAAETKQVLTDYMTENATSIVEKSATMGGTWHFVEMETIDAEELIVEATFEDGHIQQILEIDFDMQEGEVSYEVMGEVEDTQTGADFQNMAECNLLRCDGEVDCYGCSGDDCKNPDPNAECKPYEEPEMGIPYSCFESEQGCALAQ